MLKTASFATILKKKNVGKKEYSFHSFKAKTLKVVVMIKREKWMRDGCGDTHGQSQPLVN